MFWFVILGILLILIIAIIVTMVKIIKGSDDVQETRERPSNRGRGVERREDRNRGSGRSNENRGRNNRKNHRERDNRDNNRSSDRRRNDLREERPAPIEKHREPRGRKGRRWKVILVDVATHEEYEFIFSDIIGIGRVFVKEGYEDYLVINDPKVSKRHCSIFVQGDSLYIQDEGSSNHTFVNNQRVNRPMRVQKEDVIGMGNTELEIYKVFRESK